MKPLTYPWFALLGVDGSGKTTVLAALSQTLLAKPCAGLFVLHRRPRLVYGAAVAPSQGAIEHYGKPAHGLIRSIVKLAAMWLDWLLGYFMVVRRRQAQGFLVVADRHALLDLLADPHRYRYGGPAWLVRLALRWLPAPDAVVLLDAPTAVLLARKQELTAAQATQLRHAYLSLAANSANGVIVDAARPLAEVVAEFSRVFEETSRRLTTSGRRHYDPQTDP